LGFLCRNPPKEFETVINTHFYLHRDTIVKQCHEWAKRDGIQDVAKQVEQEMKKLQEPEKFDLDDELL
jgi:hypothetical protein